MSYLNLGKNIYIRKSIYNFSPNLKKNKTVVSVLYIKRYQPDILILEKK